MTEILKRSIRVPNIDIDNFNRFRWLLGGEFVHKSGLAFVLAVIYCTVAAIDGQGVLGVSFTFLELVLSCP